MRFGFLGRLDPVKGVELLLRSFLQLPAGQAELVLAGRGSPDYEDQLKGLVDGRPGVHWLGFVRPDELFRRTDVLVVPSLWEEPAGMVVSEALSRGRPVIGSRRGGIPELLGEGTGWTFDPDEPGGLTQALRLAVESRRELPLMGERAARWALQFSNESMLDGYLRAYLLAIDKSGLRRRISMP